MSTTIRLKRSAVPGRVPTTSQLELGELAINTADGKIYIKQYDAVSNTSSIVEFSASPDDILDLLKTVDGAGSELDADLLDGQQGTYYLDYNNFTNTPSNTNILDSIKDVDGSGSGLDADTIDGLDSTQFLRSDTDDTLSGNLTITGNLTVTGNTTYVNTEEILLSDNVIVLNANFTGPTASENAGIEVERGGESNVVLQWNESLNQWEIASGGVTGRILTTGDEGSGNGLDSDTLDGQEGSYYLDFTNATNKPDPQIDVTLSGKVTGSGSTTLTDLTNGSISITTALSDTGVTSGSYGSSTAIPIITVDEDGRITNVVTSSVAGIDSTDWYSANNTYQIQSGDGSIFNSNISQFGSNVDFGSGIDVSGNITVTGTVDGRDIASDGLKLDGIESGATGDQTPAEILTAIKTVDGAGSDLDADLLDGQQGSYYLDFTNFTNIPDPTITVTGDVEGSVTLTNLGNGSLSLELTDTGVVAGSYGSSTAIPVINVDVDGRVTGVTTAAINGIENLDWYSANNTLQIEAGDGSFFNTPINVFSDITVEDLSANSIITQSNVTVNGNISVTGTVDGRDVAADGTKLDGIESGATGDQTPAEILTAIKTVDGAGSGLDADTLDGQQGTYYLDYNNFTNTPSATDVLNQIKTVDGAGSGLDADLFDGLDSTQFLRSDVNDTFSGDLVISGNLTVSGTTTTVNTETILLSDNIITLNANHSGPATQNAGIEIERGSDSNVILQWNEGSNYWEITSGGVTGRILTTGDEGSGNGLDSDTLDGQQGSYYLDYTNFTNTPTASDLLTDIKTVDGVGSGLDADLLDGQQGSYYLDFTNATNKPDPQIDVTLSGKVTGSGSTTLTNLGNGSVSITTALENTGVTAATYGSSLEIPVFTVDEDGRITSASNQTLQAGASVTSADWYSSNNTFNITLSDGVFFNSVISQFDSNVDFGSGIDVTGNITVTGTVDGRDIAADGTKLDGIEPGATGDQTASEILTLLKTVDGAGSGLDADLLDGFTSQDFFDNANTVVQSFVSNSTITVVAGNALDGGGTFGLNEENNRTITIDHADTSSVSNVNNSNGTVIQDLTFDTYGHVQTVGSINLDDRYYTETESDSLFVNVTGDTVTGNITLDNQADLIFRDNNGTFPTQAGGFVWDLNNDSASIYAQQPTTDHIDFFFKITDNAGSTDRFVFWVDDYRGAAYDRYPAQFDGSAAYLAVPVDVGGNKDLNNARFRVPFVGDATIDGSRIFADNYHPNADKWTTARTVTFSGGDVTGSFSIDGSANVSGVNLTIQPDSVALGTDTTGNYVESVSQGTGITVTGGTGEGSTPTIAHADTSSVTNVSTTGKEVISSITFDTFGHVTARTTRTLDVITQAEADLRYVNVDGDTMTGDLTVQADIIQDHAAYVTASATTTATTPANILSFNSTTFNSAEVIITATQGINRHITKLLIVHNGTTASATEFGTIYTNNSLASYDVGISGGNVNLTVTAASATSTEYKIAATLIID